MAPPAPRPGCERKPPCWRCRDRWPGRKMQRKSDRTVTFGYSAAKKAAKHRVCEREMNAHRKGDTTPSACDQALCRDGNRTRPGAFAQIRPWYMLMGERHANRRFLPDAPGSQGPDFRRERKNMIWENSVAAVVWRSAATSSALCVA